MGAEGRAANVLSAKRALPDTARWLAVYRNVKENNVDRTGAGTFVERAHLENPAFSVCVPMVRVSLIVLENNVVMTVVGKIADIAQMGVTALIFYAKSGIAALNVKIPNAEMTDVVGAAELVRQVTSATKVPACKSANPSASTNSVDQMGAVEVVAPATKEACVPTRSNVRWVVAVLNVRVRNAVQTVVAVPAANVLQVMCVMVVSAKHSSVGANPRINPVATVVFARFVYVVFHRRAALGCGLRIAPTFVRRCVATVSRCCRLFVVAL